MGIRIGTRVGPFWVSSPRGGGGRRRPGLEGSSNRSVHQLVGHRHRGARRRRRRQRVLADNREHTPVPPPSDTVTSPPPSTPFTPTSTAPPAAILNVHASAFCSDGGALGKTKNGTPEICTQTSAAAHLRWRRR
jgi:hypothetical protein